MLYTYLIKTIFKSRFEVLDQCIRWFRRSESFHFGVLLIKALLAQMLQLIMFSQTHFCPDISRTKRAQPRSSLTVIYYIYCSRAPINGNVKFSWWNYRPKHSPFRVTDCMPFAEMPPPIALHVHVITPAPPQRAWPRQELLTLCDGAVRWRAHWMPWQRDWGRLMEDSWEALSVVRCLVSCRGIFIHLVEAIGLFSLISFSHTPPTWRHQMKSKGDKLLVHYPIASIRPL